MRAHAESVNLQFENPLDEVITHIEPDFYGFCVVVLPNDFITDMSI